MLHEDFRVIYIDTALDFHLNMLQLSIHDLVFVAIFLQLLAKGRTYFKINHLCILYVPYALIVYHICTFVDKISISVFSGTLSHSIVL